jgi:hypothetical protein
LSHPPFEFRAIQEVNRPHPKLPGIAGMVRTRLTAELAAGITGLDATEVFVIRAPPIADPGPRFESIYLVRRDERWRRYRVDGVPLDRADWDKCLPLFHPLGGWQLTREGDQTWPPLVERWLKWFKVADHPLVRGGGTEVRDADNRLIWSSAFESRRSACLPGAALLTLLAGWLAWPRRPRGRA